VSDSGPLLAATSSNYENPLVYTQGASIANWSQYQANSAIDYWSSLPGTGTSFENITFDNPTPPSNLKGDQEVNLANDTLDEYNSLSSYIQSQSPNSSCILTLSNVLLDDIPQCPPDSSNHSPTPLPPHPTSNTPSPRASTPMSKHTLNAASRIERRTKNTLAARRYRQKRVDQVNDLELALKNTQMERDALKVRVARLEGEAEALGQMLRNRDQ
jgi:hypothetical protein